MWHQWISWTTKTIAKVLMKQIVEWSIDRHWTNHNRLLTDTPIWEGIHSSRMHQWQYNSPSHSSTTTCFNLIIHHRSLNLTSHSSALTFTPLLPISIIIIKNRLATLSSVVIVDKINNYHDNRLSEWIIEQGDNSHSIIYNSHYINVPTQSIGILDKVKDARLSLQMRQSQIHKK